MALNSRSRNYRVRSKDNVDAKGAGPLSEVVFSSSSRLATTRRWC